MLSHRQTILKSLQTRIQWPPDPIAAQADYEIETLIQEVTL